MLNNLSATSSRQGQAPCVSATVTVTQAGITSVSGAGGECGCALLMLLCEGLKQLSKRQLIKPELALPGGEIFLSWGEPEAQRGGVRAAENSALSPALRSLNKAGAVWGGERF